MESKRFSLNAEQQKAILRSIGKYTAPLFLLALLGLQQGKPVSEVLWLVYGALLQLAINFLSKFISEDK